jgi:hypothetical protein
MTYYASAPWERSKSPEDGKCRKVEIISVISIETKITETPESPDEMRRDDAAGVLYTDGTLKWSLAALRILIHHLQQKL